MHNPLIYIGPMCSYFGILQSLYVFEIFADGKKVGISVARNAKAALASAHAATTRHTQSKMDDVACDFGNLVARRLGSCATPMNEGLPEPAPAGLHRDPA